MAGYDNGMGTADVPYKGGEEVIEKGIELQHRPSAPPVPREAHTAMTPEELEGRIRTIFGEDVFEEYLR